MATSGNGKLLTARELAEWFDVTPKTIREWTRHGDLVAIELPNGDLRYDPATIDEWVKAHTRTAGK